MSDHYREIAPGYYGIDTGRYYPPLSILNPRNASHSSMLGDPSLHYFPPSLRPTADISGRKPTPALEIAAHLPQKTYKPRKVSISRSIDPSNSNVARRKVSTTGGSSTSRKASSSGTTPSTKTTQSGLSSSMPVAAHPVGAQSLEDQRWRPQGVDNFFGNYLHNPSPFQTQYATQPIDDFPGNQRSINPSDAPRRPARQISPHTRPVPRHQGIPFNFLPTPTPPPPPVPPKTKLGRTLALPQPTPSITSISPPAPGQTDHTDSNCRMRTVSTVSPCDSQDPGHPFNSPTPIQRTAAPAPAEQQRFFHDVTATAATAPPPPPLHPLPPPPALYSSRASPPQFGLGGFRAFITRSIHESERDAVFGLGHNSGNGGRRGGHGGDNDVDGDGEKGMMTWRSSERSEGGAVRSLWRRYGPWVLGGLLFLLIVIAVAAVTGKLVSSSCRAATAKAARS